jgi:RecB family exonuclease
MNNHTSSFNWTISEGKSWPPSGSPKTPFSPTTLEILRKCPLRLFFEFSDGYERKLDFSARVGLAFHHTLQALIERASEQPSIDALVNWAQQKFLSELEQQEKERAKRIRECGLSRDENRIYRSIEAIIAEAHRVGKEVTKSRVSYPRHQSIKSANRQQTLPKTEDKKAQKISVEVSVQSKDKLIKGRIDRVEESYTKTVLYDFKSALRDDMPEQYERQLQLYAWLWHEKTGRWPQEAYVVYPITGTSHEVTIHKYICKKLVAEYRELINQVMEIGPGDYIANPGDSCRFCEFRPWCRSFWNWQSEESKHMTALERAYWGFEGTIKEMLQIESHWKVILQWRNCRVNIIAPLERFPHLERAEKGIHIRALEMKLHGQMMAPRARVTERSELFLVK